MACGIAISAFLAFRVIDNKAAFPAVNSARIEVKPAVDLIEENYNSKNFDGLYKFKYKVEIIDTAGNILYNNYNKTTGREDLKSASGYDLNFTALNKNVVRYSSPVIVNGNQKATAVFYIAKNTVVKDNSHEEVFMIFLPAAISLLLTIIILISHIFTAKNQIITPINEIEYSTDAIIKGNFDKKIKYNNDTEVGRLCASFEMMRDELKNSIERERRLETSRKELITCISHDLRTPISSIKAYVEGIMDGIAKDKETLNRYLSVINKKTQVLTKLIDDLFEHCQIELDKLDIKKREMYSGEYLEHIRDELSLEFKSSGQTFESAENMPNVLIKIDPVRIEQVIYNLIQNARKYTPEDGKISFMAEIEDDYLKVSVKDNGAGVDLTDLPFIFDKFYRGEKMRNSDKGGSGLGLSICKYIVERHGGQIFVESNENGSNFYFVIPKL